MPYRPKGSRFWHYDFQIRGRRFHGSCGTEDFEEAKAVEAAARVKAKHAPQITGRFTLSEAFGTYYSDVCAHQPSARTAMSHFRSVLGVIDGKTHLDALKQSDLTRFRSVRRWHVSGATINRTLQAMGRALRYMEKHHGAKLAELDFKAVKLAEPKERVRSLTLAEQGRLFEKLRPDLLPLVKFALMTGARQASICNLRWRDIDHDAARMTLQMKTDSKTEAKTMAFPMSREIKALIGALPRAEHPPHRDYVFTFEVQNRKKPERRRIIQNSTAFEHFAAAVNAAGIEDFRFHDLRHTFATRMLRQTQNLKLVSRLLGHSEITTTSRYAHVLDDDLASALDGFSALQNDESRRFSRRQKKSADNS
ncbi:tyrosine-type recombinase/integrase [Sagittula stellata]|uniref:Tyr recombinase domain-containing protein n=1 Tax=Sagittula stellata (strain ATCC 700073 / DSM 11524 / E-37) TaxID=388399 RepID=A3K1Y3_SAGS3|nr:site-specific integrase [Sagittula stellata]EBA08929.1 hypothetical protein SSE37_04765 [Sagittula stellata E-37]